LPTGIGRRFVSFEQAKRDIKNNTLNNRIITGMKRVGCVPLVTCADEDLIGDNNDVKSGDECSMIWGVY